jgi:hypothetical protein
MDYVIDELKIMHDGVNHLWTGGYARTEAMGIKLIELRRKVIADIAVKEKAAKEAKEKPKE